MNWKDTQQKRCTSGHRSKSDSATDFMFPKATWRIQEAALVTLEQATPAKASMTLSPDLQVLSMCQGTARHLPSYFSTCRAQEADCHWKQYNQRWGTPLIATHTVSLRGGLIMQPRLTSDSKSPSYCQAGITGICHSTRLIAFALSPCRKDNYWHILFPKILRGTEYNNKL